MVVITQYLGGLRPRNKYNNPFAPSSLPLPNMNVNDAQSELGGYPRSHSSSCTEIR